MFGTNNQRDKRIIRDVLAGKTDRFADLVGRYLPSVYATALAHTRNRADADDVVQDTFVNAYTALDSLRAPAKFGPWILTIARNVARKHLRRRDAAPGTPDDPGHAPSPATAAQRAELLALLTRAVGDLAEGEREVILLHYFAGRSAREIAEALGVSRAAVLKRLERGRAHLGEQLLQKFGDQKALNEQLIPSVERVMKSVLAATAAWHVSKAAGGGGAAWAASTILPKTTTIAACLTGMAFAGVIGWTFLSRDTLPAAVAEEQAALASNEETPVAAEFDVLEPETAPLVAAADTEESVDEPTAAEPESATGRDGAPQPADSDEPKYTSIDGLWEFTARSDLSLFYPFRAIGYSHNVGRVELSGAGGDMRVVSAEGPAGEIIADVRRAGNTVELEIVGHSGHLEGAFNAALTELVLEGTIYDLENESLYEARLIGTRVSENELTREAQIEELKQELRELYAILEAYAQVHGGEYPDELDALYPQYVLDQERLRSNDTRSLIYRKPPPILRLVRTAESAEFATDAEDLLAIQHYLEEQWGRFFQAEDIVLESEHFALGVRLALTTGRGLIELSETKDSEHEDQADVLQIVSCQDNLKQLGLSFKIFADEQAGGFFPPGFHTMYPGYLPDLNVLTCPSTEHGSISYEVVFPGATKAQLVELARQVEGLSEQEAESFGASYVPMAIEVHECSGTVGRNVLFLDGHAELLHGAALERLGPYLNR